MKQDCLICEAKSDLIAQINGFVEGVDFNIFQCPTCGLQFANGDTSNLDLIYNSIYTHSSKIRGYDRYVRYFNEIHSQKGKAAINYLTGEEDTYKYIYRYLNHKENCREKKILEVGSGLGYFTYALSEDGFNILGIDLSEDAVSKSASAFGNLYKVINLNKLYERFDIIILTEVIEHVSDPVRFLNDLKELLVKDGEILLTTPRNLTEQRRAIWLTELPPVHLFWFTTLSLRRLGKRIGLEFFEIEVEQINLVVESNTKPSLTKNFNTNPNTNANSDRQENGLLKIYCSKLDTIICN